MNKLLLPIIALISLASLANAQVIYETTYKAGAKKVYVTQNKSEAKMIVYQTRNLGEAQQYLCRWYWAKTQSKHALAIFFTKNPVEADLIIYMTNNPSEARSKCNRKR